MKTLGRILIILVTFAFIMGITYAAVNAVSSSTIVRSFERGGEGSPRPEGAQPQFPNGQRPESRGGEGREFLGQVSGLRLIWGTVKNVVLIGIIVASVVWLKDFLEKRKRVAGQAAE
jgi:hypothetical protein